MITEYDKRVYKQSEYIEKFYEAIKYAMNYIRKNFMDYAEKPEINGYSNKFKPNTIMKAFDTLILKYGFEIDARTIRHAYGIGNNNEWDIVDKNLIKIGEFYATNNMYHGVILGVQIEGKTIDSFEICSGGFIRG